MLTSPVAYFQNIRALLQQELSDAQNFIQVAVAWFTDQSIYDLLLKKAAEDVSITVIIRNDVINVNATGIDWQKLVDMSNATLYFSNHTPHLHHKFCIIDGRKVISGSYNWTYTAQQNHENIVVFSQPELIKSFRQEYDGLLDSAREVLSLTASLTEQPPANDTSLMHEASMEVLFRSQTQEKDREEDEYEQLVSSANNFYHHKDYVSAERNLLQALLLRPTGAEGHGLLAQVYWRTEQLSKSITSAKKAEENGLQGAALWNVFGLVLSAQHKFKEAIEYYNRSIAAEPGVADWYHNRFLALFDSKQDRLSDNARLATVQVASDEIKKYKNGSNDFNLLRAYIVRAALRNDIPEARKDAKAAREVFNRLPVSEQDLHDLDDINAVDKSLM